MHVRVSMDVGRAGRRARAHGRSAKTRWSARVCTLGCLARGRAHGQTSGSRVCARTGVWPAGVCAVVSAGMRRRVYCSAESTSFTRNHLNDLK
ncbi:hypothetical protein CRG98_012174 [Punica granatum]|uniref:Uncharacterized protein n=1 Tax=Punica granatum TaxID=22663 RepID=A0A2I0KG16_PUNGR|nr:hypothetical protein CRG98_012174 [Punica granatum]